MSAFKNFLITVVISAVIFGLIGFFSTGFVTGIVNGILEDDGRGYTEKTSDVDGDEEKQKNDEYDGEMPEGENFTYLFIGTDYDTEKNENYFTKEEDLKKSVEEKKKKNEDGTGILKDGIRYINATWFVLLRVDKDEHEVLFSYISPETEVSSDSGIIPLAQVYGIYGVNRTKEYIEHLTGLDIGGYVITDALHIGEIVEQFGGASFSLPCDIYAYNGAYTTLAVHNGDVIKDEKTDEDKKKETASSLDGMLETVVEYEQIENEKVLDRAENAYLSDYSIEILNMLKEYSAADITLKGDITVSILKGILTRCVKDWTADDLKWKIKSVTEDKAYTSDDPYEEKTLIATDIDQDGIGNFHSMMQAIDYFTVLGTPYPGTYMADELYDRDGSFTPDLDAALKMYGKYKQ